MLVLAAGAMIRAADDDTALRKRALALNEITGDDPIRGEIRVLTDDKDGTKKLLAVALKMAKEKDPPFNFNHPDVARYPAEVTGYYLIQSMRRASFEGKRLLDFGYGVRFSRTIVNLGVDIG